MEVGKNGRVIMNKSILQILSLPAMVILSLIFLYSAYTKIIDPDYFIISISYYQLFPILPLHFAGIFLIMLELVTAIAIWIPQYRREAALLIGLMLVFFIIIIFISILRGLDISCGCFGHESTKVGFKKILENGGLLFLSYCIYTSKDRRQEAGDRSKDETVSSEF